MFGVVIFCRVVLSVTVTILRFVGMLVRSEKVFEVVIGVRVGGPFRSLYVFESVMGERFGVSSRSL